MYTILVNDDNTLLTTVKERIMQRSKLVDNMHFIANKMYKDCDMETFTVWIEYRLPVSKEYKTEVLTLSNSDYDGSGKYLEYMLPFDTNLTKEAGQIEVQLTFINVMLDTEGNGVQYVRKTSPCTITIVPVSAWSDIIPDGALNVVDQKMILLDARMKELEEMAFDFSGTKADDLIYNSEDQTIQLTADGKTIGGKISVNDILEEGTPVIDIDTGYSVVEF
jgi:hypothetical protein